MLAGAIITIIGLYSYSTMQTITHMILIYLILAMAQVCAGQVPTMLVVVRWFKRHRGIAVGIVLMGTSIGAAIFPLVVRHVLAAGTWRDAVHVLAIICAIMMVLPVIIFIRSRPEDMGLRPDGERAEKTTAGSTKQTVEQAGPTLRDALRMPAFYLLAVATGALWFSINGIVNHQAIFMSEELGIEVDTYALIYSAFFWFAIVGKLLFGYLGDRFSKTLIMVVVVVNLILGLLILRFSSADHLFSLYAYAAVYGIGFSGTFTMIQLVIAEFFAGNSYGKILGILTMVDVAAAGIAINLLARMEMHFGSYLPVFEILIGICCAVAVSAVILHKMQLNALRQSKAAPS
jgi:sugar phosphate permease